MAPEDFRRAVGGSAVLHDVIQAHALLAEDALQRRLEVGRLLEGRRHHGDPWQPPGRPGLPWEALQGDFPRRMMRTCQQRISALLVYPAQDEVPVGGVQPVEGPPAAEPRSQPEPREAHEMDGSRAP